MHLYIKSKQNTKKMNQTMKLNLVVFCWVFLKKILFFLQKFLRVLIFANLVKIRKNFKQ